MGPAWHLGYVEVVDESSGKTFFFRCNNWLSKSDGDKLTERELMATDPSDIASAQTAYKVMVHTMDIKNAGTDADVFLEVFGRTKEGKSVSSGRTQLRNSSTNLFERGNSDAFVITCPDLGTLERLVVAHNNRGVGPGWALGSIEVTSTRTSETVLFPYNGWLDLKQEPYAIEATLYPDGAQGSAPQHCSYRVVTHTSDIRGAGTDARVFCSLEGTLGRTKTVRLDNSANNFERNMVDTFTFQDADVGKLTKLTIGHDK